MCLLELCTLLSLLLLCHGEQLHIALTREPTEVVATWVTPSIPSTYISRCRFGTSQDQLTEQAIGDSHEYTDGGFNGTIHVVTLKGLRESQVYYYVCGEEQVDTEQFRFMTATPTPANVSINIIGDMGIINSENTMRLLKKDVLEGNVTLTIHVGDIS